jgi:hypothetical protein
VLNCPAKGLVKQTGQAYKGLRMPTLFKPITWMPRTAILLLVLCCALGIVALVITPSVSKRRAESLGCANAITSICLAAHLWADDHGGIMPTNFICMSDEISTPKVLSCVPARRARTGDWSAFTPDNCTYEIVSPGLQIDETNRVFLRCTIHGHLGYSDCTVFDGVRRRHKFD